MRDLINKAKQGDQIAFKQLVLSLENDLYRIAKTRLKYDDDIEDAIQNTMIITYNQLNNIHNSKSFKSWIISVLINECNKIYNNNKKDSNLFDKCVSNIDINSYDDSIQKIQDAMNFESLIASLNYEERLVITLYYNSLFSCSQIAKILNSNVNTIKSRLSRAKMKLKKMYKEVNYYEIK